MGMAAWPRLFTPLVSPRCEEKIVSAVREENIHHTFSRAQIMAHTSLTRKP